MTILKDVGPNVYSTAFSGATPPVLNPLYLSADTMLIGIPQGALVGYVEGITFGTSLDLTFSAGGQVQLVGTALQVGPSPPMSSGVFTITIVETLPGAAGSSLTSNIPVYVQAIPAPVNVTIPVITGVLLVGQSLLCSNGTWTNFPTSYTYQWFDSNTGAIGGATSATYVPTLANLTDGLSCQVTAINATGASIAASSLTTAPISTILNNLTLSAYAFNVGAAQGTVIGAVTGATAGSTLSLISSGGGATQLVAGVIQVGPTPPGIPGSFPITISETLTGASNSPRSSIETITETPSLGNPLMQLVLDMSTSFPYT